MDLSFDTETTGVPYDNLPLDHPKQPRLVQIGALLFDENGFEIEQLNTLVEPNGWEVDYDSELVHGWTTEDCAFLGIPARDAIEALGSMMAKAGCSAAHHFEFDRKILEIEAAHDPTIRLPNFSRGFCTMKQSAPVVGIHHRNGYKWPNLLEAYEAVTGRKADEEDLHDAMFDARLCKDIFVALRRMGIVIR